MDAATLKTIYRATYGTDTGQTDDAVDECYRMASGMGEPLSSMTNAIAGIKALDDQAARVAAEAEAKAEAEKLAATPVPVEEPTPAPPAAQ